MIHERVRAAREAQGLTLRAVADAAKVDDGHLSRFERGEREMSGELLERVLAALGLRLEVVPLASDGTVPVPPGHTRSERGLEDEGDPFTPRQFTTPDAA